LLLALALLVAPAVALAQDRPSEEDLFGTPPPPAERPQGPESAPQPGTSEPAPAPPGQEDRVGAKLAATENPLAIGGLLYLRSALSARQGEPPSSWTFTAPSLLDVYLDARPSDRVRGFVLGRMQWDPTIDPNAQGPFGTPPAPVTQVLLDQLWLRFDVERVAFLTLGKQHVKWGTGRFWNPTDYLHAVRRDPLALFDQRTGTALARVHVPWERLGWNLHAMAILEPLTTSAATGALAPGAGQPSPTPSQQVGGIGGAARAEIVLGPSEIGLGAVVQRGHHPRFAVDASAGFAEVDLYGEAALKTGSEIPLYREVSPGVFAPYEPSGLTPQVAAGVRWAHKYSDEDSFELGLEGFYNRVGYDDPAIYPTLIVNGAFAPFYVGRAYLGTYGVLPRPGSWNQTTFILSVIANLSDGSGVTRLDVSTLVLTYLTLELSGQVRFGDERGEFRLGGSFDLGGRGVVLHPGTFDLGLAVRLGL
jgi:hypothetical protein